MRQLNGVYSQHINRAHGRVGPLFQGRFKGILVEKDRYLLERARSSVLNPVRAGSKKHKARQQNLWAPSGSGRAPSACYEAISAP